MIPIGVVTRNRYAYLDVTIRSLSASRLPADQAVVVFDDASDDAQTIDYLYSSKVIPGPKDWPTDSFWEQYGLSCISLRRPIIGISGTLPVITIGKERIGVVNASCTALKWLFALYPHSKAVILLQDDVLVQPSWLEDLILAERRLAQLPGLIAGCRLNRTVKTNSPVVHIPQGGVTAQCYYITNRGKEACWSWIHHTHHMTSGFDNKFCNAIRKGGADVFLVNPSVCQHFGVVSQVRPTWGWRRLNQRKGRVDYTANAPFAMAHAIRRFSDSYSR